MTDIPHDTLAKIAALKLPPKTQMAILKVIADMTVNRAKKGTLLASDWAPSESDVEYGLSHGLSLQEIDVVAERMRLWAGANSHRPVAKKANWGMTFKGFLHREAEQRKGRNGAMDVILELEERSEHLHSTKHNGANGHARGNGRNGTPAGGGLLSFFGPGDTNGTTRNR